MFFPPAVAAGGSSISYPLYASFFPRLLRISTSDVSLFFGKYLKKPICFVPFPHKKTSVFNVGGFKQKMPASKDMSQGSQVPIPEEANALQSFMQNNVARNAVNMFWSGVDGLANFKNLKIQQENNEND